MKFSEVVAHTVAWLQREGRVSYRALKREFALDEEFLEDLKEELIAVKELAIEKDGKMLVWVGATPVPSSKFQAPSSPPLPAPQIPHPELRTSQPPSSYTPPHLAERIRAEQAALEARGSMDGERKTITALFADLKGSTALIEGLDPEEARAIIDPALQLMMDAVHRYEGYVAQALGDGIFALFGAPIAHEDHPQRALYAALRMQEEMRRYADALRGKGYSPLLMRVGLNTGEVVVRSIRKDDLHTDYVPVGHSTNLAARMEQLAAPGSILVTEQTHKLTNGYFAFKTLGKTQIKGVEEPLYVYEVLGAGPLRTRLQVTAASRGLTRFVGRQSELEQLSKALEQAQTGHGQIVGVMGEPGLGKSRLFYEFKLTAHSGCLVLDAFSVSYGKASPYLPLLELLKSYFQIQPQDDERTRREKVGGKVLMLDRSLEETLPYLFFLLGLDDATSSLQQMDLQIRRRRTFEAIKRLFLRESLNQLLILIFEDLHWIDTETQGFLDALSESMASARLLLLVNYRPEYRHEWGSKTYYTQLRLAPLSKAEAEEFLDDLLGEGKSPRPNGERARVRGIEENFHALKQLILDKTEGTPFFMEEIVQDLLEQGVLVRDGIETRRSASLPSELHLPPTVQGVLAARIDRLTPDEKDLLQQLAVIGREFPLSLLCHVLPQPEDEVYRVLASLQRKEFLYEQPAFPEIKYIFKHALTQEVAYSSVLVERRKALHERTAQAIETLYSSNLEDHYSELAHHYSRSSNTEKAMEYLQKAGQQAVQRSANTEAISHLSAALELLKTLPGTPERNQQELTLLVTLGPALMATKSPAVQELEQMYTRAQELCQQVGDTPQLFPVLHGLYEFHLVRGALRTAHELAEQFLGLTQRIEDPAVLTLAHNLVGEALFFSQGEFAAARHHYERGIACYDPQQHHSQTFLYGLADPGVFCLTEVAEALWLLGYPDQARQRSQEALTLARELAHPMSLVFALLMAARLHIHHREAQAVYEQAAALVQLCTDQGIPNFLAHGAIEQGWALAEQGEGEKGTAQIRQGLAALRALGVEIARPTYLAWLTKAYQKTGRTEEGLSTLDEALELVRENEERWYEAELYRLRGELTLQQFKVQSSRFKVPSPQHRTPSTQSEAEACFLKALAIAQKQHAKSWELRASISLARLWQQQGKIAEAHQMLAEIYNWFTEGFDTKDLQEAKGLLAELA